MAIVAAVPAPGHGRSPRQAAAPARLLRPFLRGRARPVPASPAPLIAFGQPVAGYPVVSPFGLRQLPWEETGRLHKGVDIAAPEGTPVLAAADGVVLRTGVDAGYGRFVQVEHAAGLSTLYGHLEGFAPGIRPGAAVREGQTLGPMGSTGSSTGSHLHFEVHDAQGRPLNPELFMGRVFRTADDLPLRKALRLPRGLRIAYVSFIPPSKEAQLLARKEEEEAAQAEAAEAAQAVRAQAEAAARAQALALAQAQAQTRAKAAAMARDQTIIATLATAAVAPPRAPAVVAATASTGAAPAATAPPPSGRIQMRFDPASGGTPV